MTDMASATTPAAPALGLRERKKIRTRQGIRHAAYRLFERQGYDATTVEQIAAAAEVSPSTFFRYFPTKEDVVLTDEYDPLMEAALLERPADEPIVDSLRQAVVPLARQMAAGEHDEMLQRMRLVREVPAIRARMGENMSVSCGLLVDVLARRTGRPADDLGLRIVVGALLGGWQETMMHWVENDGTEDLGALLERTLDILADGLGRHAL
ncbi:TetR family transcriptional regulator [Streptomyces sp. PTM05]|uniref:TetR family transcriptional regulator n=1 Tax=Streptantibioticus parmotrematis TaxID=2873249 RepID=A0ABS7QLE8_9ACTN|nr:TetR family transcriptional regulator [Streptantibioticus parmotrematis]MBY8884022.1 TetR family transcriptional regulator [Streptantibioticus parmotrematis]